MCVYSLEASQITRGKQGQRIITHQFPHSIGFAPAGTQLRAMKPIAVCLLSGSEVSFAEQPHLKDTKIFGLTIFRGEKLPSNVATLIQLNRCDYLFFPDRTRVLLNKLRPGLEAVVLSLPAVEHKPVIEGEIIMSAHQTAQN